MKKRKKKLSREEIISEWLDLYPFRLLEFEFDKKEKAVIFVPPSENWVTRYILPKMKQPTKKIHLDDIGTFVWERCNGQRTVRSICDELEEQYAEEVQPVEERTVIFLQQMYKQNFIRMYTKQEPVEKQEDK